MLNKKLIFLLLFFAVFLSHAQSARIKLTFTYTQPYCGGARPTTEMELEAQKPRPYANKMMIIVSDNGKVDSAKTDANGIMNIRLKSGNYKIYENWRYYKKAPDNDVITNYDAACLKEEWAKEVMTVKKIRRGWDVKTTNSITVYCPWARPCIKEGAIHVPE